MRALAISLLFLGACATTASSPGERAAGCWISRDGTSALTMRWLRDPARPGVLAGTRNAYGEGAEASGGPSTYTLTRRNKSWSFCQTDASPSRCWMVAQGVSGSLQGGRAFIDAHGDRLRISVIEDGAEREVFNGRRDGCD